MTELAELLKRNKNLVLTGAPGTGKTYLAIKIAEELTKTSYEEHEDKGQIVFVQFHPSYDYTDFVEGLRPTKKTREKEIGFERKDGVFKAFCKNALKNFLDSKKEPEQLKREKTVKDQLDAFLEHVRSEVESKEKFAILGFGGKPVAPIIKISDKNFTVNTKEKPPLPLKRILQMYEKFITQSSWSYKDFQEKINKSGNIPYFYGFLDAFRKFVMNHSDNTTKNDNPSRVERKNFVFIIDEINRGEVSKIFGELFFAIDSGYRGKKGEVQTQYQNLVKKSDVFSDGFFVPKNVYIIGTMNDIDRSVESMEFAMRRRFAWKEITAASTQDMLDNENAWKDAKKPEPSVLQEIKTRMDKLNEAIIAKELGLSTAYQIGASYFLKYALYADDDKPFEKLWDHHIKGVLFEYLRGAQDAKEKLTTLKNAVQPPDDKANVGPDSAGGENGNETTN